jgi:hypothetical protein
VVDVVDCGGSFSAAMPEMSADGLEKWNMEHHGFLDDIFQNDIFSHRVEKKIHQIHHYRSEMAVYLRFCH